VEEIESEGQLTDLSGLFNDGALALHRLSLWVEAEDLLQCRAFMAAEVLKLDPIVQCLLLLVEI